MALNDLPSDAAPAAEPALEKEMMDALFGAPEKKKPVQAAKVPTNGATPPTAPENALPEASSELQPEDLPEKEELEAAPEPPEPVQLDDEAEFEVTVDEKTERVKLKDLKANYSGEKAIQSRIQAASEARNEAQQHARWLYEANVQALDRIQQLDSNLTQFAEPPVDMDRLRQTNYQEYLTRMEQQLLARERKAQLKAEADQIQQNQTYLNEQASARYLEDQAESLRAKVPELSDPSKAKVLMASIQATISDYGYTEEELRGITDHRVFLALRDLAFLKQLRSKKASQTKEAPKPSVMLRPGSNTSNQPSQSAKAKEQAITQRAWKTGSQDDVAAYIATTKLAQTPRRRQG